VRISSKKKIRIRRCSNERRRREIRKNGKKRNPVDAI